MREQGIELIYVYLLWSSVIVCVVVWCCNVKVVYIEYGCWECLYLLICFVNCWTMWWNDLSIVVS